MWMLRRISNGYASSFPSLASIQPAAAFASLPGDWLDLTSPILPFLPCGVSITLAVEAEIGTPFTIRQSTSFDALRHVEPPNLVCFLVEVQVNFLLHPDLVWQTVLQSE